MSLTDKMTKAVKTPEGFRNYVQYGGGYENKAMLVWYGPGGTNPTTGQPNLAVVMDFCLTAWFIAIDKFTGERPGIYDVTFSVNAKKTAIARVRAESTIRRALKKLVADGFLVLVEERANRPGVYRLGRRLEEAIVCRDEYLMANDLKTSDQRARDRYAAKKEEQNEDLVIDGRVVVKI